MVITKKVTVKDAEIEVDVKLDFSDVLDYLRSEHDSWNNSDILDAMSHNCDPDFHDVETYISNADMHTKKAIINQILGRTSFDDILDGTLVGEMKEEWWELARKKYSLEELEDALGNKFEM